MNRRNVNIMPMAGEGKRFKKAGYKTPKPLININGEPMVCSPDDALNTFYNSGLDILILENLVVKK